MISKLPERNMELDISWTLTEPNDSLRDSVNVELIQLTPKIPCEKYRKRTNDLVLILNLY